MCVCGWECRALVAATDRATRDVWDGSQETPLVGFLDCRPLLIGWLTVSSWDPWLPLDPIKRDLDQSAPVGWHTVFPQLPPHWTWTCWSAGQILVVAFAPDVPSWGRQLTSGPPCGDSFTPAPSEGTGPEAVKQTGLCQVIPVSGVTGVAVETCHRVFLALAFATFVLPALLQCDIGLSMLACGSFLVHRRRFPTVMLYALACSVATASDAVLAVQIGANYHAPTGVTHAWDIGGGPSVCATHPAGELDIRHRLRTIATPCKASVPWPLAAASHHTVDESFPGSVTDSLVTLLEESAWSADSRAFFEASTLLEVLFRPCGCRRRRRPTAPYRVLHFAPIRAFPWSPVP